MIFKDFKNYEEFEKWFDGSKIVKNGKPLLLYHFNNKTKIDPYNPNRIYFTDDPTFGKRYLGTYKEHKAYLKIINPFICYDKNLLELYKKDEDEYGKVLKSSGISYNPKERISDFNDSDTYERNHIFNIIKRLGHDGAIIPYDWDGGMGTIKSFVVFDKNQIWEI